MKKFAWLFIVLLLTGCGSNLEKLDGKWRGDPAGTVALASPEVRKDFADAVLHANITKGHPSSNSLLTACRVNS